MSKNEVLYVCVPQDLQTLSDLFDAITKAIESFGPRLSHHQSIQIRAFPRGHPFSKLDIDRLYSQLRACRPDYLYILRQGPHPSDPECFLFWAYAVKECQCMRDALAKSTTKSTKSTPRTAVHVSR